MSGALRLPRLDSRVLHWGQMETRSCPICGSAGQSFAVRPDELIANRCVSCDCIFISPAPTSEALSEFYSSFVDKHSRDPLLTNERAAEVSEYVMDEDYRLVEISSYINIVGARTLDVGCSYGGTLVRLGKAGASPVGIDVDAHSLQFAREKLQLNVECMDLINDNGRDLGTFDLVTMFDFIEHPLQPMRYIERSVSLLNGGGVLAVFTPNGSDALCNDSHTQLRVDLEHMQYLSYRSCRLIADAFDLDLVHLEGSGYPHLDQIDVPLEIWRSGMKVDGRIRARSRASTLLLGLKRRMVDAYRVLAEGEALSRPVRIVDNVERRDGNYHLYVIFRRR
jgi:2-polyprenyl-3-methyl-5-hydroxy-6-metoxy-1,4-benzoquinol methylase